ncbi:hypothetical protein HPT25_18825 [Bacillus sp. BRMEA1]|uniref:hypothetical protein n=1 Tax=Neobacillus endophyticus TaxID=2738405 RepID=UPI001565E266|nr:hypothetical protein [Neobacillus endophyticus]NRD79420.1 hypothetical protein [Neobacillus endophyticus]
MAASWRVNVFLGLSAFLFTYLFSNVNNTWQMSLFRAGIGFLIFFILGFVIRFVIHQLVSRKNVQLVDKQSSEEKAIQKQAKNIHNDKALNDDVSFQSLPLNALHDGDINTISDIFSDPAEARNVHNQEG